MLARYCLDLEEAVDEVGGQVERLGHELELEVHIHQPVDQNGPHLVVDVGLAGHVVGGDAHLGLDAVVKLEDVLDLRSFGELMSAAMGSDPSY